MTYLVKDECIKCKLMDCVEVCPVDCFYEGENMLVINPDECIDCGVCEPECPVEAIVSDVNYENQDKDKWLDINKKYSNFLFILVMGFSMSLIMTLIITYINTGMDNGYLNRFMKAWVVGLPIAIAAAFLVGPLAKKFVDKITKSS